MAKKEKPAILEVDKQKKSDRTDSCARCAGVKTC
jgi:hypothetical protein